MPNHTLPKNVSLQKILTVVQYIMMTQTEFTIIMYMIFQVAIQKFKDQDT